MFNKLYRSWAAVQSKMHVGSYFRMIVEFNNIIVKSRLQSKKYKVNTQVQNT